MLSLYGSLYFAQDVQVGHWTFLLPMRSICARFAQDCTSLPNAQYMRKIASIIGRNMSHIACLL